MQKLLEHSAISQQQRQKLLEDACAEFAAAGLRMSPAGRAPAVRSLRSLAEACGATPAAAHATPDAALPPTAFSAAATLLASMPYMHAAHPTDVTPLDMQSELAGAVSADSQASAKDASSAAAAGTAVVGQIDIETGSLVAALLRGVPERVSDAHVAVHAAESAAFAALPHTRIAAGPLWVRPPLQGAARLPWLPSRTCIRELGWHIHLRLRTVHTMG